MGLRTRELGLRLCLLLLIVGWVGAVVVDAPATLLECNSTEVHPLNSTENFDRLLDICFPSPRCRSLYGQDYGRNVELFAHIFLLTTRLPEPRSVEQASRFVLCGNTWEAAADATSLLVMEADAADPADYGCEPHQRPVAVESGRVICDDIPELKSRAFATPENAIGFVVLSCIVIIFQFLINLTSVFIRSERAKKKA